MNPSSRLFHVVLYKLSATATDEQRARIAGRFKDLVGQVEGVLDVWVGDNSSLSQFAAGWPFGVVMTLSSNEARDAFLQHEMHLAISRDAADGFYDDVAVFDLEI